jgi:hypothetical protein
LGDAQYTDAGPDLWMVVVEFRGSQDAPLARAAALENIGKVKAVQFAPQIAQLLKDFNAKPPADRNTQIQTERVAFGAIKALENLKEPIGYEPVFFATLGWYNVRIKSQASVSLPNIIDDPTEFLLGIVKSPSLTGLNPGTHMYDVKKEALYTSERSESPNDGKASVAVAALAEGWRTTTNDVHLKGVLLEMRKLALNMIAKYTTSDVSVYPNIDKSYKNGGDLNEKLNAVAALKALSGDEAATLLASYVTQFHQRKQAGTLNNADQQLVRSVIPALGATKNAIGRPPLSLVQNSPVWEPAIQRLAGDALREIAR